jgi:hypothetical protein
MMGGSRCSSLRRLLYSGVGGEWLQPLPAAALDQECDPNPERPAGLGFQSAGKPCGRPALAFETSETDLKAGTGGRWHPISENLHSPLAPFRGAAP